MLLVALVRERVGEGRSNWENRHKPRADRAGLVFRLCSARAGEVRRGNVNVAIHRRMIHRRHAAGDVDASPTRMDESKKPGSVGTDRSSRLT